jgi:hypothetical protein
VNKEVPIMSDTNQTTKNADLCNLRHARLVVNVLEMLITVVGRKSVLGVILGQARSEIVSLVCEEHQSLETDLSFLNN